MFINSIFSVWYVVIGGGTGSGHLSSGGGSDTGKIWDYKFKSVKFAKS